MRPEWVWIKAKVESHQYADSKYIEKHMFESDLQDDDGYPTDIATEIIERWSWNDDEGLLKFIESIWWCPSFGWHEEVSEDKRIFNLSTGGWSGNESLIYALEQNHHFAWHRLWVQSRRGGHYIFEIENKFDIYA
jgi:hypothetical protein